MIEKLKKKKKKKILRDKTFISFSVQVVGGYPKFSGNLNSQVKTSNIDSQFNVNC